MSSPTRAIRAARRRSSSGRASGLSIRTIGPLRALPAARRHRARPVASDRNAADLAARLRTALPELCEQVKRPEMLSDVLRAVGASLEPSAVAAALIDRAASWLPVPSWVLVVADRSGTLSRLAERALEPSLESSVHAIARWVIDQNDAFLSADLRVDARVPGGAAATVIALPLVSRGVAVGALIGTDVRPSTRTPRIQPAARRALATLLDPAAMSLENALRLERAEALSVTDDLTHLYNSRYLNLVLRRETKRATRGGRPLSLLFIDLDGFKAVNDAHGHLGGSRALVEAGAVIRGCARETDTVARFGGDEFALVLPDTGSAGALAVADRIRERIARHEFLAGEGRRVRLTASVGAATLPDVAGSADGLVQQADAAMYQVKARGKNGIQAAVNATAK